MTKRMLIDSTHAEETRVVVLDGNRLEDYDVETSTKQQLKGNIYLAKIVRVEPSLQAAFVEFGGGRHGFLAFGEIHPDYYQIPVADRKRLLEMQEAEAREEEEEEEREAARRERGGAVAATAQPSDDDAGSANAEHENRAEEEYPEATEEPSAERDEIAPFEPVGDAAAEGIGTPTEVGDATTAELDVASPHLAPLDEAASVGDAPGMGEARPAIAAFINQDVLVAPAEAQGLFPEDDFGADLAPEAADSSAVDAHVAHLAGEDSAGLQEPVADAPVSDAMMTEEAAHVHDGSSIEVIAPPEPPEHIGGELDTEDRPDRRPPSRFMRNYKIQEVMRRRQILLVQVVKEERGTKGAALTTYISLAGRFSVLMPNSPRGGGISRKITSAADRRRLKEITGELDLPRGMGLIVRTAGAQRPKTEIIRDCEYLLDQWDQIRDLTMKSMAPTLIYEEASLIKRAIRDVYSREVEEILVDGETGWRAARDFMRMLMPGHAKKVQLWRDPQPLFAKAQVENQLDAMLQPTVQLRSGGYLVINQTEALVAIDVNSGRSTRERGIEETAVRTNLEAAEEAARQLRLRDLAGLIVIDFIDMESRRNNAAVEKKLKDSLKNDRARIQVGSISHFGLLEMSRQRLRPSLAETSFVTCVHCGGTGHMRSTESAALAVLRGIEDEGGKRRAAEIIVHVHGSIALYVLNHKRVRLAEIEERFGMHVTFNADDGMIPPVMRIEKVRALLATEGPLPISQLPPPEPFEDPDEEVIEADDVDPGADMPQAGVAVIEGAMPESDEEEGDRPGETAEEGEQRRRKRRRRRRGGRRDEAAATPAGAVATAAGAAMEDSEAGAEPIVEAGTEVAGAERPDPEVGVAEAGPDGMDDGERKRRGRRGGRRRRREPLAAGETTPGEPDDGEPDASNAPLAYAPAYTGPTPANPFGGDSNAFAFFDAVEEVDSVPPPRAADRVPAPSSDAVAAITPVDAVQVEVVPGDAETSHAEEIGRDTLPEQSEPTSNPEMVGESSEALEHERVPVSGSALATSKQDVAIPDSRVAPVLVGDGEPAPEPKKGWWRR